ncbi:MAG: decarboxylating 6-phosphogluconate dehydrogenase [Chloroflexi bacterium]|nr:decarboxylating 6-phosphogluconate dehydrogenase [Chloroflexota bacterium]
MRIAMVGLGRMGANMTQRLIEGGHEMVAFDLIEEAIKIAEAGGAEGARTLEEVKEKLEPRRYVWVMVPSGDPTENTIWWLSDILDRGDVIIDGGNSFYKETLIRAKYLAEKGIHFVDVGTSGGIWGLKEGYSMMIGGEDDIIQELSPIFETLAPDKEMGWGHVGPNGAGHFVKMIHNGIEYGMMQAYAEGFDIMRAKEEFGLNLHQIAEIWRYGSVIRSWLLDLTARALTENPTLDGIRPWVDDSGEGRWTAFEAIDQNVPAPVITLSLMSRFASRELDSFTYKLLAAMRGQFGGHSIKKVED